MLKDPLTHLLLIGAGTYLLYALLNPAGGPSTSDTFSLPALTPQLIADQLSRKSTPIANPSSEPAPLPVNHTEKSASVNEAELLTAINNEILLRQAYRLRLFEDAMIRERLINKAKFALEGQFVAPPVTDETLQAFYQANKADYKEADTISFEHALIKPDQYDQALKLLRETDGSNLSRRTLTPLQQRAFISSHFKNANQPSVKNIFGQSFLEQLLTAPLDQWRGLVESKHGKHLVKVTEIRLKPSSTFASVRDKVRQDWIDAQRAKWLKRQLEKMRTKRGIDLKEFKQHVSS